MKATPLSALFFVLFTLSAFSQTSINTTTVSGTWKKVNSPYLIQRDIYIADGTTLTIEPGVKIDFQGSYKLLVLGQILAIGKITDTITFTSSDTATGWIGIQFENTNANNDTSRIKYCKIEYCKKIGDGGALYFYGFSKASILNNKISNNSATSYGGGIKCDYYSCPIIAYNKISENFSANGGGIQCNNYSNPLIYKNNICNNSAGYAGGIYCSNRANANIHNNIITGNSSTGWAGGISCAGYATPDISGNIISNNTCGLSGGGVYCYLSGPNLSNNVISNNEATDKGGGVYMEYNSGCGILFNTICNNKAQDGGGIYCKNTSSPYITNTILWNNTAADIGKQIYLEDQTSQPVVFYCDVDGGVDSFGLNTNVIYVGSYTYNINQDPSFVNPSAGTGSAFDGTIANWSLQSTSICINGGNPFQVIQTVDILGNDRIYNQIIDIGAYEYQGIRRSTNHNTLSIIDNENTSSIHCYPNPAKDQIIIEVSDTFLINGNTITLYNDIGEKVLEKIISSPKTQLDISSLSPGIFSYAISGITQKSKIVIIK